MIIFSQIKKGPGANRALMTGTLPYLASSLAHYIGVFQVLGTRAGILNKTRLLALVPKTSQAMYEHACTVEPRLRRAARAKGKPYAWLSVRQWCYAVGLPNSGRNRTLIGMCKKFLQGTGLMFFKKAFRPFKKLADYFLVGTIRDLKIGLGQLKVKSQYKPTPPNYGVKVIGFYVVPGRVT